MICNLFVFRHAETTDNANAIFSGWRDPDLTQKGVKQAQAVAEQLKQEKIDIAFTSHLKRARRTLNIVLEEHPEVPVFVDDRLIERCYGLLQGESKTKLAKERPECRPVDKPNIFAVDHLVNLVSTNWLSTFLLSTIWLSTILHVDQSS